MSRSNFNSIIIFTSKSVFEKFIKSCGGIPCHVCIVQPTCYNKLNLKENKIGIKLTTNCHLFDKWYEKISKPQRKQVENG